MNLIRRASNAVQGGVARLTQMIYQRWPRSRSFFGGMRGEHAYTNEVGDGRGSALLMACVSWVVNGFTQMRPIVIKIDGDDELAAIKLVGHAMTRLFRRPTYDPDLGRSFYTWMTMIAGLIVSFIVDGNAYALKVRGAGGFGKPVQLWYTPHWMLKPMHDPGNPSAFIDYYDYCPDGVKHYRVEVQDVVHLRDGIDPDDTRKGLSKVKVLLREIFTDEEAARWTASLLRNHAVPGLVLSPKQPLDDPDDAKRVKQALQDQFTQDGRGLSLVLGGPTDVTPYGFSPEQMKLGDIRDIPEERVSAAVGIPAAVVGFGAGLQSTKVGATMAELVDLAWQNGVLPRARIIAAEFTEQLLSEFEKMAGDGIEFAFDTSTVPIMADYHLKVTQIHDIRVRAGIETRGEAKRALGVKAGVRDDVYILTAGTQEVDATKTLQQTDQEKADAAAKALPAPAPQLALPAPKAEHGQFERAMDLAGRALDAQREASERIARVALESSREQAAAVSELATAVAKHLDTPVESVSKRVRKI